MQEFYFHLWKKLNPSEAKKTHLLNSFLYKIKKINEHCDALQKRKAFVPKMPAINEVPEDA